MFFLPWHVNHNLRGMECSEKKCWEYLFNRVFLMIYYF